MCVLKDKFLSISMTISLYSYRGGGLNWYGKYLLHGILIAHAIAIVIILPLW